MSYAAVCVLCQVLADAVSRLVVDKFSELTDNFTSPHARRKVLAGVVMTTGRTMSGHFLQIRDGLLLEFGWVFRFSRAALRVDTGIRVCVFHEFKHSLPFII